MINNAIMEALQVYYVIGRSKSLRLTFSNLILEYVIFSKRLKFIILHKGRNVQLTPLQI